MIRRRGGSSSKENGQMEKGVVKTSHSRVCFLVLLSVFLWVFLFYFHFVVLGGPRVDDTTYQINPVSVISSGNAHLSNSEETLSEGSKSTLKNSSSDEKVRVTNHENNGQVIFDERTNDTLRKPKRRSNTKVPMKSSENIGRTGPKDNQSNARLPPFSVQSDAHLTTSVRRNDTLSTHNSPPSKGQVNPISDQSNAQLIANDHSNHAQLKDNGMKVKKFPFMRALRTVDNKSDPCGGRYVFVHDLPPRFNEDMLKECRTLSRWTNMCKFTTYAGLGPPLENVEGVFSDEGWYATNQFAVDVIFSNRMKQYECLTHDSSLAAAIFVPFYAGFDVARYLWGHNISTRDAASLDLVDWLSKRPEWGIMGGKDHFLVAGRITWDFRRLSDSESDWGNKLLFLPAGKNMSMLVVESSPWNANDFAIPYPTYFHPAKDSDVFLWQERMRKLERKWLFSFAGAPRPGNPKSIRGNLIEQCRSSEKGKLLECDFGESKCHSPSSIMKMFQSSVFCLQPQGDSFTRRSAFDSMLAGCIPVFFHPGSAYTQYVWHLPKNYSKYSVFIPEDDIRKGNVSLEQRLNQISDEEVKTMREEVINLIPRLIYADPRSKLETLKDAFDVSVQAIIDKVTGLRRDIVNGRTDDDFIEEVSWRFDLVGREKYMEPHEWDPFFSKPKGGNEKPSESSSAEVAKNSWKSEQRAHS